MKQTPMQILMLAADGPATISLIRGLSDQLDAEVTLVDSIRDAHMLLKSDEFEICVADATITDGSIADASVLDLIQNDDGKRTAPIILLEDQLDPERLLAALRGRAIDVFPQPIDTDALVDTIRRTVLDARSRRRSRARARRLRTMSAKLVKDRRELRRRVDLICSDLVEAYRRLAEKVVTIAPSDEPDTYSSTLDDFSPAADDYDN